MGRPWKVFLINKVCDWYTRLSRPISKACIAYVESRCNSMCIWIGLGVKKSSGISVRARYRFRGGKDFRFIAVRVVLGLHAASLPLAANFGPAARQ